MCFIWFIRLPLSETERAVVFGYSLTRLVILLFFAATIIFSAAVFFHCQLRPEKSRQMQAALRGWFGRRDFLATCLLACLAAWGILGLAAEVLLNPAWFPRSALYHYLYIRIRPIFLWTVLVAVQAIILVLACGWYRMRNVRKGRREGARALVWGVAVLVVGNLTVWGINASTPDLFGNQHAVILAIIIALALFEVGLVTVMHFRRDPS